MSQSQPILTNFSLGEVSPLIEGRFDLQEYTTGLRQCENFRTTPQGGIQVREGTLYVDKSHAVGSAKCRLVEFIFSRTEAYVLEFTTFLIRVGRFNPTTGEPEFLTLTTPITTPYGDSDIDTLDFSQRRDAIYISHPNHPPGILIKFAPTSWIFESFSDFGNVLNPTPFAAPASTLNANFQNVLKTPFWNLGNNKEFFDLFSDGTKHYDHSTHGYLSVQVTIAAGNFAAGSTTEQLFDVEKPVDGITYSFDLTNADVGAIFHVDYTGSSVPPYSTNDYWIITTIINSHQFKAKMLSESNYYSTTKTGVRITHWSAWSARAGYPNSVCFHEQRLVLGGTKFEPQVVWGSVAGDYQNFNPGAQNDADSYVFKLSSSDASPIRWMESCRILLIGTEGGEYRISGTSSFFAMPITPTSDDIKPQTSIGGGYVKAKRVGQSVFFIDRSKRKLLRLDYVQAFDNYLAADMVHIAEHISLGGIKQLVWQGFPNYTLWAVRDDGQLCGLTYVPELKMQAWQRIKTDGYVESVACIPDSDGEKDRLWISCKRVNDANGLVALYKFDGVKGDTYVKEEISNLPPRDSKNYEDLSGKFWRQLDINTAWQKGVYGNAAFLNGDQEFISINPHAMPDGDFSLAFWLIPGIALSPSLPKDMTIVRYGDDSSTNDVAVVVKGITSEDGFGTPGQFIFKVGKSSITKSFASVGSAGTSWIADNPHFIVCTFSSANGLRIYVDKNLDASDTGSYTRGGTASKHFQIGKQNSATPPAYEMLMNGGIDHFRIYNRELTQEEVTFLYGNGA